MRIKLFADGADLPSMLDSARNPMISGFTTNPTLMRAAGVRDYATFAHQVLSQIRDRPISFEVFSDTLEGMRSQALAIARWGENVYVKIPITNTTGNSTEALIADLSRQGVKINVTAVLPLAQVETACRALRGGAKSIVSVFAGRIADTGRDPIPHMRAALEICSAASSEIELLWASPREVLNVRQADEAGCHIITATPEILRKLSLFEKTLEEMSLDTVRMFHRDAEAAGYSV